MAVVRVTGFLADYGRAAIPAGAVPRLAFRPKWPGNAGAYFMTSEPVAAVLNTDGAWSAMLEECDLVSPRGFHYIPEVTYFRSGKPIRTDSFERTPLYVPVGGGSIRDIMKMVPQAGDVVWGEGKPTRGGVVWIDYTDVNEDGAQVYAPRKA